MNAPQALSAATATPTRSRLARAEPSRDRSLPPARSGRCPLPDPCLLERGAALAAAELAYELCGPPGAPVVVVLGGISAHRHVTATHADAGRGWWADQVGSGAPIDTRRLRVLSFDWLGGNGDSTGPRAAEETFPTVPFPTVSTADQAGALAHLLDHLGIARIATFVGASYGGMVALSFAARHPHRVDRLIVLSAADRSHPHATALRSVQRSVTRLGLELGAGRAGLALARSLAMVTYRSPAELELRFDGEPRAAGGALRFPVEDYLQARGESFAGAFHPGAFLCLSESIDLHRVDARAIATPTTLVSVRSDQLVPPAQLQRLARLLAGPSRLIEIDSLYGHDAFLKETGQVGRILHRALVDLGARSPDREVPR
ncbi:MAG TPA: homoserine O-succinyltransferase [Thermoanaerobaculia bacterium]|nr:homoserine O-succinyltransferase [Thermoanaerobaculia bacterium]